jgi:hypothetical protein
MSERRWDVVRADTPEEVESLLDLGWEPYAVYPREVAFSAPYAVHWLRKERYETPKRDS